MWRTPVTFGVSIAGATALGTYIGAKNQEQNILKVFANNFKMTAKKCIIDDANSILSTSVMLANLSPSGYCILSTTSQTGGVSSRVMQALPVKMDGQCPEITFQTTSESRKFGELTSDPRCTLTFVNPSKLTSVSFVGKASRLNKEVEHSLFKSWPLTPSPASLYAAGTSANFTAWTFRPSKIEIVSPPEGLVQKGRVDWRSPEIEMRNNAWEISVPAAVPLKPSFNVYEEFAWPPWGAA